MPRDEEYIAGLEGANDSASANSQSEEAPQASAPAPEGQPAPTPSEMFEFDWQNKKHSFPTSIEFPIPHNGQIKRVPASTLFNTYRQAEHFSDKNKAFNAQLEKFKAEFADAQKHKEFYDKYGALQEWSLNKPDEFQAIWDLYQNRDKHLLAQQAGVDANNPQFQPFYDKISSLEKKLGEFEGFKKSFDQEQEKKQQEADVAFVKNEIDTFKKDFPEINLDEVDPDGVSLRDKIIVFGVNNNYPDFESAALKFLKSRVLETVSYRARNDAAKSVQNDKRQGIVARSSTPFPNGQSARPIDPRKHTYDEINEMAKAEYARLVSQGN